MVKRYKLSNSRRLRKSKKRNSISRYHQRGGNRIKIIFVHDRIPLFDMIFSDVEIPSFVSNIYAILREKYEERTGQSVKYSELVINENGIPRTITSGLFELNTILPDDLRNGTIYHVASTEGKLWNY